MINNIGQKRDVDIPASAIFAMSLKFVLRADTVAGGGDL